VPHHRGVRATAERRIVLLISAVDAGESTWPPRAGVTDLSESGHAPGLPTSRSLPLGMERGSDAAPFRLAALRLYAGSDFACNRHRRRAF